MKTNDTSNKQYSSQKLFTRFVNLTETTFETTEIRLLEKGFKYNLKSKESPENF